MSKLLLVTTLASIGITTACAESVRLHPTETVSTKIAEIDSTSDSIFITTGNASWYGPGLNGNKTASGEIFDMNAMTAAHRTLTFGSKVKVTNQKNGKATVVCINDRGPYSKHRVIDVSKAAANEIDMISSGTAKVTLEILNKPTSGKSSRKVCQN